MLIQQNNINLYFNRGAFVRWFHFDDPEGIRPFYGIIECEHTHRPGWYYVRGKDGVLHSVKWSDLKLAHRE